MDYITSYLLFMPLIFIVFLIIIAQFILNDALAESRGKSRGLIFFLTFIFSYLVTLILAFLPKEEDAEAPDYLKMAVIACFIVSALIAIFPAIQRASNIQNQKHTLQEIHELQQETDRKLERLNGIKQPR